MATIQGLLPDNDIEGQFAILLSHLTSDLWKDTWLRLDVTVFTFESLGLSRDATDREVWQMCQEQNILLVTGNRNDDGPHSLHSTIQDLNNSKCLPVFTLANPERIRQTPSYAEEVAVVMLEYLMDFEEIRGAGRIWLP